MWHIARIAAPLSNKQCTNDAIVVILSSEKGDFPCGRLNITFYVAGTSTSCNDNFFYADNLFPHVYLIVP